MGSWNIGAYIVLTNAFCLIGEGFRPQIVEKIKSVTKVPLLTQRIYEEDLIGCFVAANSHGIILPSQALDEELTNIKEFVGDAVIVEKLELKGTHNNAFGNILLLNDKIAVMNATLYGRNKRIIKRIEDILDVEVVPFETNLTEALGSYALVNTHGFVASPLFSEEEIEELRRIFGIPRAQTIISTVNMGNPIVRSGAVANDYSLLVGNRSSGIEIARIYNALVRKK